MVDELVRRLGLQRGRGPPARPRAARDCPLSASAELDADRIAAAVAGAVGLAEGPAGVRAVVRAVAAGAGSTRAVGRQTSLPLPLVAAVCGELRSPRGAHRRPAGPAHPGRGRRVRRRPGHAVRSWTGPGW